jgi:filamentous hemagglutinin family protein
MKALLSGLLCAVLCSGAAAAVLPQGPTVAGSTGGVGATFNYGVPNTLTINQSATRVVIDWRSFSIGAGGTVNFNQASPDWIAFNRVNINPATGLSPLSTIAGALNAKGGVWLFSTGGILFGSTAVVNVGSFAGVTGPLSAAGGVAQLLNPDANGLTTITIDTPRGPGVENVTVQNGAQITAASGYVVLQGETMVQNGAVTASDGVEYLAAETGQVSFTTTPAGEQMQGAGATIVPGQDRPSFSHAGTTKAAWVGIDTPGGALKAGYHTLINLGGLIEASGVRPGFGDNGVVLLVGQDLGPSYPGYTGSSIGIDGSAGTIDAANGLFISTDSARMGHVNLGGPLDLETYGNITVTAPVSVGQGALLRSAAGTVAIDANLTAVDSISAFANAIAVGPSVTVRSDAAGSGGGGVIFSSAGDVTADPSSLIIAGGAEGFLPSDMVTIKAGGGAQGGNITLGGVSGARVFVQSHSRGFSEEGAITLAGPIVGQDGVTVLINDVTTAGQAAGDLQILGNVTSGGFLDLENTGPSPFVIGPNAQLTSSGSQIFLYGGGDTTISSGAQVTGVSILDHTLGVLTIASGAAVTTTGASSGLIGPVIPFGSEFQRASGLNLAAAGMQIAGSVNAGTASAPDDIYIEVLGPAGATAVIGGAGGGTGFDLSDASFGNLHARNVVIMGGPGEKSGAGESLQVQNLTLDSAKIAALWLGTASSQSITVAGQVAPIGASSVDLHLGFVRLGAGGSYSGGPMTNPGQGGLDGFIPGQIVITGALGAPTAPLGAVSLIARNDIFVGDAAFVAAAQADPAFDAVKSSAAFPGFSPGQIFVAAHNLQLGAQGRIIQQNTGSTGLTFTGLQIGAPSAALPLIFAPQALAGQTIGGEGWSANYAAGPTRVDLFGALALSTGRTVADVGAATQPNLLDAQIPAHTTYRINGCAFGAPCLSPTTSVTFQPPQLIDITSILGTTPEDALATVLATAASPDIFSAFAGAAPTLQQDTDRLGAANPFIEIGNGDLWAGPSEECPKTKDAGQDCKRP